MAATNLKNLQGGQRTYLATKVTGTGVIANGDTIATDTKTYGIGSIYINTAGAAGAVMYVRTAAAGVAADWVNVNA
jgi:hypothetical protein